LCSIHSQTLRGLGSDTGTKNDREQLSERNAVSIKGTNDPVADGSFFNYLGGGTEEPMEENINDISAGQNPAAHILSTLADLAAKETQLSLTRLIKGIRFNHDVNIVAIYPDYAVMQTSDIKIYTTIEGNCHLHNQQFAKPVSACLIGRNLPRFLLVLANFSYLPNDWIDRYHDRVQPKVSTRIQLQAGRREIGATLVDVDMHGMGIFLRKSYMADSGITPGARVIIDLQLPPKYQWKKLAGIIVNIEPVGAHLTRAGIHLEPNPGQFKALERYLNYRKIEILDELNETYCRALEPRRVEDLFF
jgi:hypothetical protein